MSAMFAVVKTGCRTVVRQLSVVFRQSSGCHQLVVRQSSGSCQAVIRWLPDSCQIFIRWLSGMSVSLWDKIYTFYNWRKYWERSGFFCNFIWLRQEDHKFSLKALISENSHLKLRKNFPFNGIYGQFLRFHPAQLTVALRRTGGRSKDLGGVAVLLRLLENNLNCAKCIAIIATKHLGWFGRRAIFTPTSNSAGPVPTQNH